MPPLDLMLFILFSGIGMAMIITSLIVCVYYNVVMSYTLYFMAAAFQAEVPWEKCAPEWNGTCFVRSEAVRNTTHDVSAKLNA